VKRDFQPLNKAMSILVYRHDQQEGPYDLEQIENALKEGDLSPTDLAWQEGLAEWVPLSEILTPPAPTRTVPPEVPATTAAVSTQVGAKVAKTTQHAGTALTTASTSKLSVLAIVAAALGGLALPLSIVVVGAIFGLGAIICGHFALSAANKQQSTVSRNVALVGTVLGYLSIAVAACIIFLQTGVAVSALNAQVAESRIGRAQADLASISVQLNTYEMLNKKFPTTDQGLAALVTKPTENTELEKWTQLLETNPVDPWGEAYVYVYPGKENPGGFDLFSKGPDRKEGTTDDIGRYQPY
jgi:general secretion pathway protein G